MYNRRPLEQKLVERERGSSNQVVVAIFRSLRGESLEDYSIRLAQAWRIGQKGLDNGVIFLIFLDDRRMRLEQKLIGRERTSSSQVVVAIFPSLQGENLEAFSIRLAQAWRIGQKGLDTLFPAGGAGRLRRAPVPCFRRVEGDPDPAGPGAAPVG